MEADLRINKIEPEVEKWWEMSKKTQKVGYFRDYYNSYGLFNFVNSNTKKRLSWW